MGRSRGSGGGSRAPPRRPAPSTPRPGVTPPQPPSRAAGTMAVPGNRTGLQNPSGKAPPAQQGQQQSPGLFGQMASTAAGVAVGSSIGHAIGGFFGGGSSAPAEQDQQQQSMDAYGGNNQATGNQQNSWGAPSCEPDARAFTKCLDENQGNMQICGWYLEQLKACQQAASQY